MIGNRIGFVDSLRCFAILGVIAAHAASALDAGGSIGRIMGNGGLGVQLFFIVSAFTIFLTFTKSFERELFPVRNFFTRRLLRIVPVYWTGIILYTALYGLSSRGWLSGPELWHYPFHILLTNIFLPDGTSSVVPGGWSISLEVMFYLTTPLLFFLITNTWRAAIFTVVAMLIGYVTLRTLPYYAPFGTGAEVAYMFWYRSMPSQLACFGFGMILYHSLREEWCASLLQKTSVRALLVLSTVVFAYLAYSQRTPVPYHYLACASFLSFALLLSQLPLRIFVNDITQLIGRISYSAYLIHFAAIQGLLKITFLPEEPNVRVLLFTAISLLITLPLAYLSFTFFEKPWQNLAHQIVQKREKRAAIAG